VLTFFSTAIQPWDATSGVAKPGALKKLGRFVKKPLPEKVKTVKRLIKD